MKDSLKKVFLWSAVFTAWIVTLCLSAGGIRFTGKSDGKSFTELNKSIEEKADEEKKKVMEGILDTPSADVAERYSDVGRTIAEHTVSFRRRVEEIRRSCK